MPRIFSALVRFGKQRQQPGMDIAVRLNHDGGTLLPVQSVWRIPTEIAVETRRPCDPTDNAERLEQLLPKNAQIQGAAAQPAAAQHGPNELSQISSDH